MSGPYCDTCVHFQEAPFNARRGDCTDPSKLILAMNGEPVHGLPRVNEKWSCSNHLTESEQAEQSK